MNKFSTILIPLVMLGVVGCSSSGSSSSDDDGTTGETAGETTGETTGGVGAQGANPGAVPNVLAEITTLDVTSVDAPRGHKVFAGNEIRNAFPGLEDLVENAYFNVDFPCSGEGVFEAYPAPQFQNFANPVSGNFTWGTASASDEDDTVFFDGQGILTGAQDHGLGDGSFSVDNIVNGDLIVGTAVLEMLVVTRIVQYEACE